MLLAAPPRHQQYMLCSMCFDVCAEKLMLLAAPSKQQQLWTVLWIPTNEFIMKKCLGKLTNFSPLCFLADGEIVITPVDVVVARDKTIKVCSVYPHNNESMHHVGLIYRYTNFPLVRISRNLKKERSWLVRPPFWRVVVSLKVKVCTCYMYATVEHLVVTLGLLRLQFLTTKDRWWLLCSGGCSGLNCIASIMFEYLAIYWLL